MPIKFTGYEILEYFVAFLSLLFSFFFDVVVVVVVHLGWKPVAVLTVWLDFLGVLLLVLL